DGSRGLLLLGNLDRGECRSLARLDQVAEKGADGDGVAIRWTVGVEAQGSAIGRLDVLDRLVAFQGEQRIARLDDVAVALQPGDEDALLHVPAQPWHADLDGHENDPQTETRTTRRAGSVSDRRPPVAYAPGSPSR